MAIRFVEIHQAPNPELLNQEWVVLENTGTLAFHTLGVGMTVGRRGTNKKTLLGFIDPGFVLQPGAKMRMCTGTVGNKSHGEPPEEGEIKNYYLQLSHAYITTPGAVLTLVLRGQLPIAKAEFDPNAPGGLKPASK